MTEHRQRHNQHQVKRRRSAYTPESAIADVPSAHHPQYYGAVPPVSRTSTAAARRMSVAAAPTAPVPFTESSAARSSDCGCCSCIAAAARAYNALQARTLSPRPVVAVPQAEHPHVGTFSATARRASDSSHNYYVEPHRAVRPTAWMRRRALVESRHLTSDLQAAVPQSSYDGERRAKRRRTQHLDRILNLTLDASTDWESRQERTFPSAEMQLPSFTLASVAGLSRSWATGVIQSAVTTSAPSSSAPSPSSSSSASSPSTAATATADRSSFSWQVIAAPLPTLVSTSATPTVFFLPSFEADVTSATPAGLASPSAAELEASFDEEQAGLERADDNEVDDEWFGFLLRRADSGAATTTSSPSSSW